MRFPIINSQTLNLPIEPYVVPIRKLTDILI